MDGQQLINDTCGHLAELERICRSLKEYKTADELQKIRNSNDQIASLHAALTSKFQRHRKVNDRTSKRREFFMKFTYEDEPLSEREVNELIFVTSNWELDVESINILKVCLSTWHAHPRVFWYGGQQRDRGALRSAFDDLETIDNLVPLRRFVLLVVLSQEVETERRNLAETTTRRKQNRTRPERAHRNHPFLRDSLDQIFQKNWFGCDKKVRQKLTKYSRYGSNWNMLQHPEITLSLPNIRTKRFEQHSWTLKKISAIDSFVKRLPQSCILPNLFDAWKAIISYYRDSQFSSHPSRVERTVSGTRNVNIQGNSSLTSPLTESNQGSPENGLPPISSLLLPRDTSLELTSASTDARHLVTPEQHVAEQPHQDPSITQEDRVCDPPGPSFDSSLLNLLQPPIPFNVFGKDASGIKPLPNQSDAVDPTGNEESAEQLNRASPSHLPGHPTQIPTDICLLTPFPFNILDDPAAIDPEAIDPEAIDQLSAAVISTIPS